MKTAILVLLVLLTACISIPNPLQIPLPPSPEEEGLPPAPTTTQEPLSKMAPTSQPDDLCERPLAEEFVLTDVKVVQENDPSRAEIFQKGEDSIEDRLSDLPIPEPGDLVELGEEPWDSYVETPTMLVPEVCGTSIPSGKVCVVEVSDDDGNGNIAGFGITHNLYPIAAVLRGEWTPTMNELREAFIHTYKKR